MNRCEIVDQLHFWLVKIAHFPRRAGCLLGGNSGGVRRGVGKMPVELSLDRTDEGVRPHTDLADCRSSDTYATSSFSSISCLSVSSEPVNSNEFVTMAFPFSTLVMT